MRAALRWWPCVGQAAWAMAVVVMVSGSWHGAGAATPSAADLTYMQKLASVESGGRTDLVNSFGYAGKYQTGVAGAIDAGWVVRPDGCSGNNWSCVQWTEKAQTNGASSLSSFLGNGAAQNAMELDLIGKQRIYMSYYHLDQYVGQTINGRVMTEQDILAGIHFQGAGTMKAYLESNGQYDSTDGNGLKMSAYLDRVNGSGGTANTGSNVSTGYVPVAAKKALGCSDPIRQRLGKQAQKKAEAMVQQAASVHEAPIATLDTCVSALLKKMGSFKALSGQNPTMDDVLQELQKKACQVLKNEYERAVGKRFNPEMFLQATPNAAAIVGGIIPATEGWTR